MQASSRHDTIRVAADTERFFSFSLFIDMIRRENG